MKTHNDESLTDKRVLLLEDNFLVAIDLKSMLERLGCKVIGPLASVEKGMQAVESQALDAGILDINLGGETSVAIAEELRRQGLPFFFLTGYGSPRQLPASMTGVKRLVKPVDATELGRVLSEVLDEGNHEPGTVRSSSSTR